MKLNELQKRALLLWLGSKIKSLWHDQEVIINFDSFCNEDFREWRIFYEFGFAGKIWNTNDKIYITGYSPHEIPKADYKKQQEIIEKYNEEILSIIALWYKE